ncbi:hypothetical protein ACGF0J_09750 [Nonomuraea sp. NPDC047897]|uniref:hypothetical protein n=1 Tax=Nonomuraea sp. NPDC047897 TaxID=3364346 RepID=UPI00371B5B21
MSHSAERRKLLRGAGVVTAAGGFALAGAAAPAAAQDEESASLILGTWHARLERGDGGSEHALFTFHADHRVYAVSTGGARTGSIGNWRRSGDGSFRFGIRHFHFGEDGQPVGFVIGTQTLRLETPERLTGTGTGRLVDLDDRQLFSGPVTFSARRFTLDRP